MNETSTSLDALLERYNIAKYDLEYILNFMEKENISPQLAMRRIKVFEKLQEKMKKAESNEKVKELTKELDEFSKVIEDLQKEKEELDKKIQESKLEQDLFQAEREELKIQMNLLMDSMGAMDQESDVEEMKSETQQLKKQISVMTAGCQTLKTKLKEVEKEKKQLEPLTSSLIKILDVVIEGKEIPKEVRIITPKIPTQKIAGVVPPEDREEIGEEREEEKITFIQPSAISKSREIISEKSVAKTEEEKQKPKIDDKLFAEPEEIDKKIQTKQEVVPKKEVKHKEEAKVDISVSPDKSEVVVEPKVEKILRLFISYVEESDDNDNFKARVASICDLDDAYVELGGLAMAQLYSYQTKTINAKKELIRLLNSWIENGLPR